MFFANYEQVQYIIRVKTYGFLMISGETEVDCFAWYELEMIPKGHV